MSKELEVLEEIGKVLMFVNKNNLDFKPLKEVMSYGYNIVKQALQRLEAIDNSNPSEALETLKDMLIGNGVNDNINDYVDNLILSVKQALLELKSIKEAYPSEALELVDKMANYILLDEEYGFIDEKEKQAIIKDRDIIKQALLKGKEPKKYLKWEDLEFKEEEQTMEVILNGSTHLLCYYRNMFGNLCIIDNPSITIRKENKDFFNDLHLEMVEE